MKDYKLALMCGTDIPVPECHLIIHQPSLREIAMLGEENYFIGSQVLCIDKNMLQQDKTLLSGTNNFDIFMMVMQEKEAKDKRDAVMQLFQLLFPEQQVMLTPRSIIINQKDSEPITIDESNFEDIQEVLKLIFCVSSDLNKEKNYNPANSKAQEIANKLMRGRKKAAEHKGEDAAGSVLSQYLSILTVGLESMSLQDLTNLTLYQIYDLIERYSLYSSWDIDIRSRLAGAKIDKPPENWMKNLH